MSPKDTSLVEEEGADMGRAGRNGVRWEGCVESCYRDLNYTSLRFMVAASMAHMNGLDAEEGTKKWRKILVIVEGNMSLSWDAKS